MAPSLRSLGFLPERSTMVEGNIPWLFPAATIKSTFLEKISLSLSGEAISPVPEILALVAIKGKPAIGFGSTSRTLYTELVKL